MYGLGRAARRQLTEILDEFSGLLFYYHGELTHETNTKGFIFLVGLGLQVANPAVRNDNLPIEASWSPLMRDALQGSGSVLNSCHPVSHDEDITGPNFTSGLWTGIMGSFQPATIHGYNLVTRLSGTNAGCKHSRIPLDLGRFPRSSESSIPKYTGTALHAHNQNVLGSLGAGCLQSPDMNRLHTMVVERSYSDSNHVVRSGNVGSLSYSKMYHSAPDISAVIAASRYALPNEVNLGGPGAHISELRRLAYEKSKFEDSAARPSSQLTLNKLSQHNNVQRDILTMPLGTNISSKSLLDQQPFQQFFGVPSAELNKSEVNNVWRSSSTTEAEFSYTEHEAELLQSLRFWIMKLLKLEGSRWLFMQNGGGCDESLIDLVSEAENISQEDNSDDRGANHMHRLPNCGDDCVSRASLVVSFGIWCIHRVLDLALVESRPELWDKYTYVLDRLQVILDVAFFKPRKPLKACACLEKAGPVTKPIPGIFTSATMILEVIKDVEQAVSGCKGSKRYISWRCCLLRREGELGLRT